MARPSHLENRPVFALPNGVGFSADFVSQAVWIFGF